MDTPRTLYKITKNSPGSEAAGEAAAALAAAYLVFRDDRDKTYATQLLAASRSVRRVSSSPCMHDIVVRRSIEASGRIFAARFSVSLDFAVYMHSESNKVFAQPMEELQIT